MIGAVTAPIIFGQLHFLLISENEFTHDTCVIKCDGITSFMDFSSFCFGRLLMNSLESSGGGVAFVKSDVGGGRGVLFIGRFSFFCPSPTNVPCVVRCVSLPLTASALVSRVFWLPVVSWIPWKLVIPSRFISWKTHFLILSGSVFCQKMIRAVNQNQFTPKMKANAVSHLLSSLVWIDQYNEYS